MRKILAIIKKNFLEEFTNIKYTKQEIVQKIRYSSLNPARKIELP